MPNEPHSFRGIYLWNHREAEELQEGGKIKLNNTKNLNDENHGKQHYA